MTVSIDMGIGPAGTPVLLDLEELLATRLLVQGNSGSGKSHLLRRLLERSAGSVQQVIIDPEGDFVTLAGPHGHSVIDAVDYSEREIARFAARIREHRASVVLNLDGLDAEGQMRCAAGFLGGLFDAPREHWFPVLVVVDEAQLFAPAAGAEVPEDVRRGSLTAMTNLMCRGRKRGLAGVIATQRLAKLAKNVAAEASNFLMGRTFLDIDMARAADLLGMERRQAEAIRDLDRGTFLALGPAVSRRPVAIRIGAVETAARSSSPVLVPMPSGTVEELQGLLFAPVEEPPPQLAFQLAPRVVPADELLDRLVPAKVELPDRPDLDEAAIEAIMAGVLAAIVEDPHAAVRPPAMLYQDFQVRCRMMGLARPPLDPGGFARRLSAARAGIGELDEAWRRAMALAGDLPEEMLGAFLLVARAAREGAPCPGEEAIAQIYGTSSLGRARRVLAYIEERAMIVTRTDLAGKRSVTIPAFGWTTLPVVA